MPHKLDLNFSRYTGWAQPADNSTESFDRAIQILEIAALIPATDDAATDPEDPNPSCKETVSGLMCADADTNFNNPAT
jgi:hypothetical protein